MHPLKSPGPDGGTESMAVNFFRGGGTDTKIHWLEWEKLCQGKKDGGLGFRRLKETNLVAINEGMLHNVIKQKYFPLSNFFKARIGSYPSFTWKSMLETHELLVAGLRWNIGNGLFVLIMGHPWLPRLSTFQLIFTPVTLHNDTKVASFIKPSGDSDISRVRDEFHRLDAECILNIELQGDGSQDATSSTLRRMVDSLFGVLIR
ncbi:UNVERIFIED_CONTAM: hypothetical protein Slati_3508000 [Sesamum latifolium]|uniref:Uncharacterized protein n=1 Tax=Sesamum latifolium TaxID=2727402 RepID=A0AAW2UL83_9LAMI